MCIVHTRIHPHHMLSSKKPWLGLDSPLLLIIMQHGKYSMIHCPAYPSPSCRIDFCPFTLCPNLYPGTLTLTRLLPPLNSSVYSTFISVFPALAQCLAQSRMDKMALDLGERGRDGQEKGKKKKGLKNKSGRPLTNKEWKANGTKKKQGEKSKN